MEEDQDSFATNNAVLNVEGLEIVNIKMCARGGGGGSSYM